MQYKCRKQVKLRFSWTKGHSDDWGNHKADKLADEGMDEDRKYSWQKRRLEVSDWGAEEFAKKMPEQWKDDARGTPSIPERLLDAAVRARRAEKMKKEDAAKTILGGRA